MTTHELEAQGLLDALDSVLVRAIKGAFWFPLWLLWIIPRMLHRSLFLGVRLIRLVILFAVWGVFVFGPLPLLEEVREPVFGVALVGWTLLALVGSAVGVLRMKKAASVVPAASKPADMAEVFV